jgi:DNA-binding transcriptional LysR family regulator
MNRNLDLQLIRTFFTVAERGSMTVAAHVLAMTQGAVSQQIKRLEDMLACQLFVRDRRALRLTAPGERLQSHARQLLALNDAVWRDMQHANDAGQVRLGVPYDLVGTVIAPLLRSYGEQHPAVDIVLVCAASPDLLTALGKGEIDVAVLEAPVGPTAGECLRIERLVWVGAIDGRAHLKQPVPVSLVAETCAFRPAVIAALERDGRAWRTVFENGNLEATAATVRADLAVSAWLAGTVPADLQILSASSGLPDLPAFAINLHVPAHVPAPVVQTSVDHLRDGLIRQA